MINWQCATKFSNKSWKEEKICSISVSWEIVRVGNMDATLVLRCLSEPESEADLRSVKISKQSFKLLKFPNNILLNWIAYKLCTAKFQEDIKSCQQSTSNLNVSALQKSAKSYKSHRWLNCFNQLKKWSINHDVQKNLLKSSSLSFYRLQNVFRRSKFFESAQKFDCI